MTVPTSDNREEYLGNDTTTVFPYAFKIFRNEDLQVYIVESDSQTLQTLGTDYSVSGAGHEDGGSVTMTTAPTAAQELVILRIVEVVQETDLRNQGAYYPETVEDEFDRSRMIDQQQQDEIDRTLSRPEALDYWDAQDRIIRNVADGVEDDDAVNKGQMDARFTDDVITKTGSHWDGKGLQARNFSTRNPPAPSDLINFSALQSYVADIESGAVGDATKVTAEDTSDQRTLAAWMKALGYPTTSTGTQTLVDALNSRVAAIGSVADIGSIVTASLADGDEVALASWHPSGDPLGRKYGGGVLAWDSSRAKSEHDGGSVFSPTVPWTTTVADYLSATGETDPTGFGCFVKTGFKNAATEFGALDNTDSYASIQAAIDYARASGRVSNVDLGDDMFYLTGRPLKLAPNCHIGGRARIKASDAFTGVTFDAEDVGGTLDVTCLFYGVNTAPTTDTEGTVGSNPSAWAYNASIGDGIELNCDNRISYGIFTDSFLHYSFKCRIANPAAWGIRVYQYGWGGEINSYISGAATGGIWLGSGCNGVNLDNSSIWGNDKVMSLCGILIDGDNNGVSYDGAFIEKSFRGIIFRGGCGPIDISGIDFEQIDEHVIVVQGSGTATRPIGPVTITGCFFDNNLAASVVRITNGIVHMSGCRVRNATAVFEIDGADSYAIEENNVFESTVAEIGSNRVIRKGLESNSAIDHRHITASGGALSDVYRSFNYSSPYSASETSGVSYAHAVTDAGTQRVVGRSDWFVSDMLGSGENGRMGLSLDYSGGGTTKRITPLDDNDTALGSATLRFQTVFAGSGSINTSDGREKQQIRELLSAEASVASKLKGLLRAFKFNDAVELKGDGARWHFGVIAQDVVDAFSSEGLDATEYGMLCYDEWEEMPEVLGDDGALIQEYRPAGNRYGVRYDELLAFVIAAL